MPYNDIIREAAAAWTLASFGGIANLLKSGKEITVRTFLAATLYSGILGVSLYLVYHNQFTGTPEVLIGLCALSGVGGISLIDIVVQIAKGNFRIKLEEKKHD